MTTSCSAKTRSMTDSGAPRRLALTNNTTQYITAKTVPFAVLQDPDTSAYVAASQSSNPYRTYLSESAVWTTAYTDALGRTTKVKTTRRSIARTSYSGNTVTVNWIEAGKARKSRLPMHWED